MGRLRNAPSNKDRHGASARIYKGVHRSDDDNVETKLGGRIQPQPNGCWLYRGRTNEYGQTTINGKTALVHRFVYETLVGPIPDDHHVHHECETPGCCNPAHLLPLTPGDHMRRHAEMRRGSLPQAHPTRRRGKTPADFVAALRRTA